jgi:hypothetical protein
MMGINPMGGGNSQNVGLYLAIALVLSPFFENAPTLGLYPKHILHQNCSSLMMKGQYSLLKGEWCPKERLF